MISKTESITKYGTDAFSNEVMEKKIVCTKEGINLSTWGHRSVPKDMQRITQYATREVLEFAIIKTLDTPQLELKSLLIEMLQNKMAEVWSNETLKKTIEDSYSRKRKEKE